MNSVCLVWQHVKNVQINTQKNFWREDFMKIEDLRINQIVKMHHHEYREWDGIECRIVGISITRDGKENITGRLQHTSQAMRNRSFTWQKQRHLRTAM